MWSALRPHTLTNFKKHKSYTELRVFLGICFTITVLSATMYLGKYLSAGVLGIEVCCNEIQTLPSSRTVRIFILLNKRPFPEFFWFGN